MNERIELTGVPETMLQTLYARAKESRTRGAVTDKKAELSPWDEHLSVSSRGYMLGYNDLKGPSVSGFFRFLSRVGDNTMNMQIVKLKFKK